MQNGKFLMGYISSTDRILIGVVGNHESPQHDLWKKPLSIFVNVQPKLLYEYNRSVGGNELIVYEPFIAYDHLI